MNIINIVPGPVKAIVKKHPALAQKLESLAYRTDIFIDDIIHLRQISSYNGVRTLLYSADEKEYLFKLAKTMNNGNPIVEIGSYGGGSLCYLGKGAKIAGVHVYGVDPYASCIERQTAEYGGKLPDYFSYKPSKGEVERTLKQKKLEDTVTLIEGFSQDVAKAWSNGKVGLLFIDGNHTQALEDFYAWSHHLAPEAPILFHDSHYPEVEKDLSIIIQKENARIIKNVHSITTITLV